MGWTRGAGAGGEEDLQSPVWESVGETAPKQAKDSVGPQCSSRRHIPQGLGLSGFG